MIRASRKEARANGHAHLTEQHAHNQRLRKSRSRSTERARGQANPQGSVRIADVEFIPERIDPSQPASRARIKSFESSAKRPSHPPSAKIEILEQGGYRRPVINRSGGHERGRFRSRKTGLTQVFEGKVEPWFAIRNEVDADVIDYQSHPFRITLSVQGRLRFYRPDAIRLLADGRIELIEVKRTPKDLSDPNYREILAGVQEIARQCGWSFRVIYLADILPNIHTRENLETLFSRIFCLLTTTEKRICEKVRAAGEPISWHDLGKRLACDDTRHADAVIETAAALGFFSFDLDAPRSSHTLLRPVAPLRGKSSIRF